MNDEGHDDRHIQHLLPRIVWYNFSMPPRFAFSGILFFTVILFIPYLAVAAASPCPSGQTYGDISGQLNERGARVPPGTMGCKHDAALLGLTCSIGDPVRYLMNKRVGIPEHEIQRMGSAFACNLARFIDAGEKAGAVMKIYSGARNFRQPGAGANCQRVPCTPSTHEKGCAADLTFNGARQVEEPQCPGNRACVWAHQNASQYGLQFRLRLSRQNGFGKPEPWHIEIAGARGPANRGAQGSCPESAQPTTPGGPRPQQPPGNPQTNPAGPPSGPPSSPPPSSSAQPSMPSLTSLLTPPPTTPNRTNARANAEDPKKYTQTGIPAVEFIKNIADPTYVPMSDISLASTSATTSKTIVLNTTVKVAVVLGSTSPSTTSSTSTQSGQVFVPSEQTFNSSDMSGNSLQTGLPTGNTTSLLGLLDSIKSTLEKILTTTQPFGGYPVFIGGSENFEG
jgi:hypothetical protein